MPKTEAGKVLLAEHSSGTPHMARHIDAIEAEAAQQGLDGAAAILGELRPDQMSKRYIETVLARVTESVIATERARLREAVEGMAGWLTPAGVRDDPLSDPVSRASVLALLEGGTR